MISILPRYFFQDVITELTVILLLGDDVIQRCLHEFARSNMESSAFRADLNLSANPDGEASAVGLLSPLFIAIYEAE